MSSDVQKRALEIVDHAKAQGFTVVKSKAKGGSTKLIAPSGHSLLVHSSYSDSSAIDLLIKRLKKHGYDPNYDPSRKGKARAKARARKQAWSKLTPETRSKLSALIAEEGAVGEKTKHAYKERHRTSASRTERMELLDQMSERQAVRKRNAPRDVLKTWPSDFMSRLRRNIHYDQGALKKLARTRPFKYIVPLITAAGLGGAIYEDTANRREPRTRPISP